MKDDIQKEEIKLLPALYIMAGSGNLLDIYSTDYALKHGGKETNFIYYLLNENMLYFGIYKVLVVFLIYVFFMYCLKEKILTFLTI